MLRSDHDATVTVFSWAQLPSRSWLVWMRGTRLQSITCKAIEMMEPSSAPTPGVFTQAAAWQIPESSLYRDDWTLGKFEKDDAVA